MNDGVLGEAKALAYLVSKGFDVFTQFAGKAPFDLVAHKDGVVYRVSVKSTMHKMGKSWNVQLRQNSKLRPFDRYKSDLLLVYIIPEDRILVFKSQDVVNGFGLNIPALDVVLDGRGEKSIIQPIEL